MEEKSRTVYVLEKSRKVKDIKYIEGPNVTIADVIGATGINVQRQYLSTKLDNGFWVNLILDKPTISKTATKYWNENPEFPICVRIHDKREQDVPEQQPEPVVAQNNCKFQIPIHYWRQALFLTLSVYWGLPYFFLYSVIMCSIAYFKNYRTINKTIAYFLHDETEREVKQVVQDKKQESSVDPQFEKDIASLIEMGFDQLAVREQRAKSSDLTVVIQELMKSH